MKTRTLLFPGKKTAAAPSSGDKDTTTEKLPSSVRSVLRCFRDFCAIMWLLHARDKMSKSSRKYRELRSQSTGNEEVFYVYQTRKEYTDAETRAVETRSSRVFLSVLLGISAIFDLFQLHFCTLI